MIECNKISLATAEKIYFLANTPMYIAEQLRGDHEVMSISKEYSENEIYKTLESCLKVNPINGKELVFPFVLLCALFLQGGYDAAAKLEKVDSSKYRWFSDFAQCLEQSIEKTNLIVIDASGFYKPKACNAAVKSAFSNSSMNWNITK